MDRCRPFFFKCLPVAFHTFTASSLLLTKKMTVSGDSLFKWVATWTIFRIVFHVLQVPFHQVLTDGSISMLHVRPIIKHQRHMSGSCVFVFCSCTCIRVKIKGHIGQKSMAIKRFLRKSERTYTHMSTVVVWQVWKMDLFKLACACIWND